VWRGLCGGQQAWHQAGGRGRQCRCAHRRSHLRTVTMHTRHRGRFDLGARAGAVVSRDDGIARFVS